MNRPRLYHDVAALYIDPRGPYPKLIAAELCYDESRDARNYGGPFPVVAHPPCGPWGRLRRLSKKDDPSLAITAVEQVRAFGGVLEHPKGSKLFEHLGLPMPGERGARGDFTIEVAQVDWGHPARKRTWLYIAGTTPSAIPPLPPPREPTHWISGGRGPSLVRRHAAVPPGIKVCSAQQRRRTPTLFAEFLIAIARSARRP